MGCVFAKVCGLEHFGHDYYRDDLCRAIVAYRLADIPHCLWFYGHCRGRQFAALRDQR